YDLEEEVPDGVWTVPLGEAAVRREGGDITVVAYSLMMHRAMAAAAELDGRVSVEIIDPRTLHPFDLDTVLRSVRKTGRLLVVHESPLRCGVGGDIVRRVCEAGFELLQQAPQVVGGVDSPIPFSKSLEDAVVPQVSDIRAAIETMVE
ncbi:MAG: transketolase C-terminal domain-containing protein, partial [Lentisphaeria bacterium]|nr:transketolase C-terminal domain-containing protein [Lentisphaeria bacterium]